MCVFAHSSNRVGLPNFFKWSKVQLTCLAPDMCVQKHTCVCPQQQLQPSIDFFCNTHVCVLTAATGLPKCWMFRTFTWLLHWIILQHTCVCSQQHLVDQASVVLFCNTCVCVYSSNWSAKVSKRIKASIDLFCTGHVWKHTCVCPQAAIGRPTLYPWVQPSMDCFWNTHGCVLTAALRTWCLWTCCLWTCCFGPVAFGPVAFGPVALLPLDLWICCLWTFGPVAFGPVAFGPVAFGPVAFGLAFGPVAFGLVFGLGAFGPVAFGPVAFGPLDLLPLDLLNLDLLPLVAFGLLPSDLMSLDLLPLDLGLGFRGLGRELAS